MQYLALIYTDESKPPLENVMERYGTYTQEIVAAGVMKAGEALQPVSTATSIRVRNGKRELTDGPFAETKEQLGGFYMLECDTLEDAIDWAAKIPSSEIGTVELRPIMVFDN